MSNMMQILSERLKELRTDNKLSTRELAIAINVSPSTISKWELCQRVPSAENLLALAIYFKVSSDFLIGLEN